MISEGGTSLDQVVAAATRVRNAVPEGASWDGKTDLPVDEATFKEMLSDRDPSAPTTQGGAQSSGSGSSSQRLAAAARPAAPPPCLLRASRRRQPHQVSLAKTGT